MRDEVLGRERRELLGEHIGGHNLERARGDELAHLRTPGDVCQRIAHFVHFGESFQHGHESPVLALGDLEIDDVVVEVVLAGAGSDGDELFAGRVDQDRSEGADLGGDVDPSHGGES